MSAKQTTRTFDLGDLCDRNSPSPRNGVQDNQDNESAVGKMTVSNPAQTVFNPEQKFIFGDWIHHSSRRSIRRKRAVTPVFDDSEVEEFEEYSPQLKSKKRKTSKPSKKYIVPQAEGGRKRPESFEKKGRGVTRVQEGLRAYKCLQRRSGRVDEPCSLGEQPEGGQEDWSPEGRPNSKAGRHWVLVGDETSSKVSRKPRVFSF